MFLTPDNNRTPVFNHVTATATIPLVLHQDDTPPRPIELLLTPDEVEHHHATLGQLIAQRRTNLAAVEAERRRLNLQ